MPSSPRATKQLSHSSTPTVRGLSVKTFLSVPQGQHSTNAASASRSCGADAHSKASAMSRSWFAPLTILAISTRWPPKEPDTTKTPLSSSALHGPGVTNLFVTPGFHFRVVDLLLTNFHLPRSTLFMLVAAFAGLDRMRAAYDHAVRQGYRFYSYGDCCLLQRSDGR